MSYTGITLIDQEGKDYKLVFAPAEYEIRLPWHTAIKFCQAIHLNGYNDWYLPTKTELAHNIDATLHNAYYWTSTEYSDPSQAWVVRCIPGFLLRTSFGPKTAIANVRPCRRHYI